MGKLNICSCNMIPACGDDVENARIMFIWLNSLEEYCGLTEKQSARTRSTWLLYWHLIEATTISEHYRKCLLPSKGQPHVGLEVPNPVSSFIGSFFIEAFFLLHRHRSRNDLRISLFMLKQLHFDDRNSFICNMLQPADDVLDALQWQYKTDYNALILQTWALV